jgi:polar amino acid transport system substrate-binding protein
MQHFPAQVFGNTDLPHSDCCCYASPARRQPGGACLVFPMPPNRIALAVLLFLCAAPAALGQPKLYLATETSAPSSMLEGGRVVGIGTDKVREIMHRARIGYTIELLPWKRAYTAALERHDACVFSTTRTPEREPLFKWVGPTDEAQWVLMARIGSGIRLKTLDDARAYRIGTYNGDARDQFLRERGFLVDPAPGDMINLRKLLLGRIDLWAASWRRGTTILEQNGWDKKIFPALTFNRIQVYLACNRAVPDALVARMNAAVEAMLRDGAMRRIERQYENWVPASAATAD